MTIDQLLAELEAMLAARRERKMGDYKAVAAEPTAEMTLPYDVSRCTGRMDMLPDGHWCRQQQEEAER